jgi:hypothetical protein
MRILLHGFGSFPIVFWHMIRLAKENDSAIEWAIILNSDHHKDLFCQLIGPERVFIVELRAKGSDWKDCRSVQYPGDLFRDIEAQKRTFKHLSSEEQVLRALHMYHQMREFALGFAPTHALVSQVEGFDGKAFIAAARSVGAEVAIPTGCRNLGGLFFSPDDVESLPRYASAEAPGCLDAAGEFLTSFRRDPKAAWNPNTNLNEIGTLENFQKPFLVRAWMAAKRLSVNRSSLEIHHLRASLLNNMPIIRDSLWKARRAMNQRLCDVRRIEELPPKFVFYPLQYSPESSINTPAPYFLDQLRAIDAIRFALPSDYRLLVKEHPACILVRPADLVQEIRKRAGVIVAHYSMRSLDLVKRSSLVISVTGTATLEALIFGKQAITLGGSLVSGFLGGVCGLGDLPATIREKLGHPIDDQDVRRAIATLFSVRHQAVFASPGMPGEPVLRDVNLRAFLQAYLTHCRMMTAQNRAAHNSEGYSRQS